MILLMLSSLYHLSYEHLPYCLLYPLFSLIPCVHAPIIVISPHGNRPKESSIGSSQGIRLHNVSTYAHTSTTVLANSVHAILFWGLLGVCLDPIHT